MMYIATFNFLMVTVISLVIIFLSFDPVSLCHYLSLLILSVITVILINARQSIIIEIIILALIIIGIVTVSFYVSDNRQKMERQIITYNALVIFIHCVKIYLERKLMFPFYQHRILLFNAVLNSCAICLDDFVKYEFIVRLNCTHIFHYACINNWIKIEYTCPLCRKKL